MTTLRDLIAPSSLEIHSSYFRLGTKYGRTIYVYGYPREIYTGWLSSLINVDEVLDVSMYIYPVESQVVLNNLRKKVTQLEAQIAVLKNGGGDNGKGLEGSGAEGRECSNAQFQMGLDTSYYKVSK